MDIPLIEGRTFTQDDHHRRLPSIVISDSLEARYWPDASALGKRIVVGSGRGVDARVVGVVGDVHHTSLGVAAEQFLSLPIVDAAGGGVQAMTMTVRTAVEPLGMVSTVRSALAEVDSDLPMARVQSMAGVVADSMSRTSFTMSGHARRGVRDLSRGDGACQPGARRPRRGDGTHGCTALQLTPGPSVARPPATMGSAWRAAARQFSDGRSTCSITMTLTGARVRCSRRPS